MRCAAFFRTEGIPLGVAGRAMAQRLHQIGAAVPLAVAARIVLERLGLVEHGVPSGHHRPETVGELQPGFRRRLGDRLLGCQIRIERLQVGVVCAGEGRIGMGGVEVAPVAADTLAHGTFEGGVCQPPIPCSNRA